MAKTELQNRLEVFEAGNGFGDPDARRNAEIQLWTELVRLQTKSASRLNAITWITAIIAVLQLSVAVLAYLK